MIFVENQASMDRIFGLLPFLFILFIPAITMRSIAEERKSGTIELLLTMPIRDTEIILGKFFAAWSLIAITLLLTLPYPITLSFLGNIDVGAICGGYLGLLLLSATYLAIGLFTSSLTQNQIIAFILSFFIIILLLIIDKFIFFVPHFLVPIMEYISTSFHLDNMYRGVINTRDLIYFASMIFFALLLSIRSLESRHWK